LFGTACTFLALAGLAGCGQGTVYSPYRTVDDLSGFLSYAAPEGEAQLEIRGNPFNGSKEALAKGLIQGFNGQVRYGPPLTFATGSKSARPGYRFIVAFGADPNMPGDRLCSRTEAAPQATPQSPFTAKAVFCGGGHAYSEAGGQGGTIERASSPEFRQWAGNLMQALTPPPESQFDSGT
jgi:hypothetical protein